MHLSLGLLVSILSMIKALSSAAPSTTMNHIPEVFEKLKTLSIHSERTTANQRIAKLKNLKNVLLSRRVQLQEAIFKDLRKSPLDVDLS